MSRKNRQMKNDITKRKKKKRHNLLAEFIIITLSIVIISFIPKIIPITNKIINNKYTIIGKIWVKVILLPPHPYSHT